MTQKFVFRICCMTSHARYMYSNKNKKRSTARVNQQGFCPFGAIFLHSPLENKLSDGFVWNANLSCYARQGRGLHWSANKNKKRSTARVNLFLLVDQQGLEPWTDRLYAYRAAFGVDAPHPASFHDALVEQSTHGSLVRAQTRSRLIM